MLIASLRCRALRDQDSPSPQVPGVEILYRVVDGVKRIGRGVQIDLALGGEHHQFDEVVVGAYQVDGDVALGGDDVYGRDLHHAAVADDVVGATGSGHLPGVVLGALLTHVVEDDLGSVAFGHLQDSVHVAVFDFHGLVRAPLLGKGERLLRGVGDDDLGRGERLEALDADVPQAPRADDHGLRARVEVGHRLPYGVVSGEASVC